VAAPGRPYFCAEPPAGHLRLSFAGVAGPTEIAEGVLRLRTAVDELTGGAGAGRAEHPSSD
jgi:DNA-binding transcriptional MocR family regulator